MPRRSDSTDKYPRVTTKSRDKYHRMARLIAKLEAEKSGEPHVWTYTVHPKGRFSKKYPKVVYTYRPRIGKKKRNKKK